MNERAGQEGPTPDFVPGWFTPTDDNPDQATREAVRIPVVSAHFPVVFLRSTERVRPVQRPQRSFVISFDEQPQFDLVVPPGYWIVRDSDGRLHNWRDETFKARYARSRRNWTPPVERDVPSGRPAAAERNRHGAEDTVEATIESSDPSQVGRTGTVPVEALVDGGDRPAWAGEPPAEGTRRWLVASTIKRTLPTLNFLGMSADETHACVALELADEIESALLGADRLAHPVKRQLRALLLPAIEKHEVRLYDGHGGKLTEASAIDLANEIERAMRGGGAAELPAEETRRRVIFAVLARMYKDKTVWPLTPENVVDAIEDALLEADETTDVDRLNAIAEERWRRIGVLKEQLLIKESTIEDLASTVDHQNRVLTKAGLRDNPHIPADYKRRIDTAQAIPRPGDGVGDGASRDEELIDEFTLVLLAAERLHDRLTDGPVPNPAELARVIEILR